MLWQPNGTVDTVAGMFHEGSRGDWFVLRTKSRQEKSLAADLRSREVVNFLPLLTQTKYYCGRKARVELPAFPGYLFLFGSLEQAYEADRGGRVAQIIRVADQDRLGRELRSIYLALRGSAPLGTHAFLRAGVPVEVRAGPFRGLQGVIEPGGRRDRLILQVELLGGAVALEIEASLLAMLD